MSRLDRYSSRRDSLADASGSVGGLGRCRYLPGPCSAGLITVKPLAARFRPEANPMTDRPIENAIVELRKELTQIDQVIKLLEMLAVGKPRRGRPPKFIAEALKAAAKAPARPARKTMRKRNGNS